MVEKRLAFDKMGQWWQDEELDVSKSRYFKDIIIHHTHDIDLSLITGRYLLKTDNGWQQKCSWTSARLKWLHPASQLLPSRNSWSILIQRSSGFIYSPPVFRSPLCDVTLLHVHSGCGLQPRVQHRLHDPERHQPGREAGDVPWASDTRGAGPSLSRSQGECPCH